MSSASPPGLSLAELCAVLAPFDARLSHGTDRRVTRVVQDSRKVTGGELFVAREGSQSKGTEHVRAAISQGAAALMVEATAPRPDVAVPVLVVRDLRRALAFAAEAVLGYPTRRLEVVGITGTNGKTTCSYLAAHAIDQCGGRAARLGTLGLGFQGQEQASSLTTPEADEVSRVAEEVRGRGATHLVMEASSHALSLGRVEAVRFRVAAFSNLTQDHLDFHGSMEEYRAAKLRLFTELTPKASVLNVDDEFGREISQRAVGDVVRVSRLGVGDVVARDVHVGPEGLMGQVEVFGRPLELRTRISGTHNLDNVLLCFGIVAALGLDLELAAAAFATAPGAPGRLQRCDQAEDDLVVLVDYAHTPDALSRALAAVRGLTNGALWCVFGCGGDRDPDKRPKMGDAVGGGADRAIVTNDNPRTEDPRHIADAIVPGLLPHGIPFEVILERASAIETAVLGAKGGDVVLIAGKGHETTQTVGTDKRPFDDRVEARRALALRRERQRQ